MFWNKDKIPDLTIKTEDDNEDLFKLEEEPDEYDEIEEKQEDIQNEPEQTEKKKFDIHDIKNINKIVNILLIVVIFLSVLISTDVIILTRTGNGPYFAIKTKTYNDGGTKVYYGIGYKVIKYNQKNGRKDTIVGSWSLKYDITPIKTTTLDLALDFNNNFANSLEKYMNKYLEIKGTVQENKDDKLILLYKDEEDKYTTKVICNAINNKNYKKNDNIKIVGTLYNYKKDTSTKLYIKNCYMK